MKLTLVLLVAVYSQVSSLQEEIQKPFGDSNENKSEDEVFFKGIPYLAFLKFENGHYCAGTLISNRYVLTAAHCVVGQTSGEVNLGRDINSPSFELTVKIKRIETYHKGGKFEDYNFFGRYKNYDIALIELAEYVEFSNLVQPAVLPNIIDKLDFTTWRHPGILAGWDMNHKLVTVDPMSRVDHIAEDYECVMQKSDIKIIGKFIDWIKYHLGDYAYDAQNTFCTRSDGKGENCAGIGGGPLVIAGKVYGISMAQTKWEDIGNSQINGTCIGDDYSMFTKVTSFLSWIGDHSDVNINIIG